MEAADAGVLGHPFRRVRRRRGRGSAGGALETSRAGLLCPWIRRTGSSSLRPARHPPTLGRQRVTGAVNFSPSEQLLTRSFPFLGDTIGVPSLFFSSGFGHMNSPFGLGVSFIFASSITGRMFPAGS